MSDAVLQFLVANLALTGGIGLVFVLRKLVRAQFGARLGYALWLLPLLAVGASLLPPRVVEIVAPVFEPVAPPVESAVVAAPAVLAAPVFTVPAAVPVDRWVVGGLVWIAGMVAMAAWLAAVQMRFMAEVRRGEAGPAVVGFLRPRIVTPTDFEDRYDPGERRVIIAHETIHLDRNDARINALAALIRCVCWFNPLVHLAAHFLRIDQELACDAAVVERHPKARKLYADALLKTQLAAHPLPLGCYWPAGTEHPLMERIEMLKRARPGVARRAAGFVVLAFIAIAAGCTTWVAKPAETRIVEAHAPTAEHVVFEAPQQARDYDRYDPAKLGPPPERPNDAPKQIAGSGFDQKSYVVVRGSIVRIQPGDTVTTVWIRARAVNRNYGNAEPNGDLWRVEVHKAITPDVTFATPVEFKAGAEVRVDGYVSKTCQPECSVQPTLVDLAPQPADVYLQPARYEQRPVFTAPAQPPLDMPAGFDASDPIHLLGKVEKIDFGATTYVAFVRAASIAACPEGPEKANTALWELNPTPFWGDRDAVIKDLMNASVYVRGFNAKDKSCAQTCRMLARGVFKSMGRAGGFSDPVLTCPRAPQPAVYEPQKPPAPEGQPARKPGAEAGDAAKGPLKNRADEEIIEKKKSEVDGAELKQQALKSKAEVEQAELKRQAMKSKAEEVLKGGKPEVRKADIPKDVLEHFDGEINKLRKAEAIEKLRKAEEAGKLREEDEVDRKVLVPKDAKPAPAPTLFQPPATPPAASIPFAKYFDADAPVMLKGRVTAIDVFEGHAMLRVEEIETTTPGLFSIPRLGVTKMWRVVLGRLDAAPDWARDPTFVGKVVEIRGYRGKDKDCGADCMMSGRDVILSGERLQGWLVPERPKPPPPALKPV